MNKKWRIINKGKGLLSITILNLQEVCCDIINPTAARTSLEDTKLIVAKEVELQAFAERVDHQLFTTAGTGVHSSYFASVVIGGTDFAIGAVQGEISSDEGYFDRHYYGDSKVELVNKSAPYTYVYIDKDLVLQQQISTPTEQDWNRKIFVMRIVVDTNTNLILGFGYYSNPIGHYGNTIRTLWKYLLANGVPFRIGQEVTGSPTDLSFDIAAGTLMVYGSTGNINAPHEKEFDLVESTNFTLIYRTTIGATVNQLPKVWDSNGTITPLGSTTCVAHRIYRYSTGDVVLAIGQGNYANMVLCKAGALLEQYVLNPLLKDAVFMGWWLIEETATSTSGTVDAEFVEYTIGIQGGSSSGLSGALLRGNNLSDLLDTAAARTNIGLDTTANQTDSTDKRFLTDAQEILVDNSVQNIELQLSQKFTSFGESYVNNFRSSMLDLGDEFFTSSAGYQIGKNKQLGLNPSLQMLPISGQAGKLRSIGSNRVNDFTVARNSTATYIDEDGLIKTALANVPRFDYYDSLDPSLLLEPQGANLITYSEDISDSSWIFINVDKNLIQLKNPSGTLGVYEIASNSNNTTHFIETTAYNATSGVDYTFSFFAKINGSNFVQVALSTGFNSLYQNFNLLDGTLGNGNLTSGYSSSIEPFDNGWYRISVKGNTISANARFLTVPILTDIASRNPSFSGDGSLGVYAWGFQKEQSSFTTSYIPTSGTTVTKLADVVDGAGDVNTFNSEEGVLYAEIAALANNGTFRQISINNATNSNMIQIDYTTTNNQIRGIVVSGGVYVAILTFILSDITINSKVALKFSENDFSLWFNGVKVATDSSGVTPTNLSALFLSNGGGTNNFFGKCKDLRVYNTALTDSELTELTTL
jgi:hypothetical protein